MFFGNTGETIAVADTLKKAAQGNGDPSWIIHHVMDANYVSFEPFGNLYLPHLQLFGLDISITKYVFFIWIVAILLLIIGLAAARGYKKSLIPKGFSNFLELIILFVRDEIVKPSIGKGFEPYLPYMLTLFFFILVSNLLGLVPFATTITGNIAVTGTLAIISFIVTQYSGMKSYGVLKYLKGLVPAGMPVWIIPVMVLIELMGLFTKPFALCVRLFANMVAGHIVIFSLIGLIFILHTIYVAPVSVGFVLFIELLELLVAAIQAYVFTMLTALFIGMAKHSEH
ncbi:MAG: F0F1 ATP synthase subunit A [Ignavibacteriaceae bacterium]|jgi:F-type H+-transporting ATPase subunit a